MIYPLQYVTNKLQNQTLNETLLRSFKVTCEDHDSGTESDDERVFEESEFASEMSNEISSGGSVRSRPLSQTRSDTVTFEEFSVGSESLDMPPPPSNQTQRRPGRQSHHTYQLRAGASTTSSESPIDLQLTNEVDESDPVEHHSSEEELETLTCSLGPSSEKRKWSQVARLSLTDSGSSDDEIYVLTTRPPVEFRTSPPLEVHKPLRSTSPPPKMLSVPSLRLQHHISSQNSRNGQNREDGRTNSTTTSVNGSSKGDSSNRASSPRKRHRHTPRPHRPSLDFEKMQQMKNRAVTQWRNGGELSLSFF